MADNFPVSLTRDFEEGNDIFKGFHLPKANATIIRSQWVRADMAEVLERNTKMSSKVFLQTIFFIKVLFI